MLYVATCSPWSTTCTATYGRSRRCSTGFLLGGDYAAFGPEPAEAVAALRGLADATWIRGNWERWCAHADEAVDNPVVQGALAAALTALDEDVVAELGALPQETVIDGVRYCHGSPGSDMDSWLPEPDDGDEDLLAGATERRIVFGHTHLQFSRTLASGVELVNPGSVGFPFDGDRRAAYGLAGDAGGVELRRVDYDVEAAAAALSERFGDADWARQTRERLLTARF
jgi:diadenosine tetraphosphatase ApaH/serine/threonine PP2A family protein phosphatase